MYKQTTKKQKTSKYKMDEQHVRKPDEPRREVLLPQHNDENDDIQDNSMKQAIQNSISSFENEYMMQCQDHVVEHDIQMMLQKEYDNQQEQRKERESNLHDLVVRLKIIDKERKYLDIVSIYIESGQPMSYDHFVGLIDFVRKPELVSLVIQYINYENH